MSVCWWCHWGWPKEIRSIFDSAVEELDGDESPMLYGPAHVVWADENWDCAQMCLDHFEEYAHRGRFSDSDLAVVRKALEQLLAVPAEFKTAPDGYEGERPELYPPPSHWDMERR